MDLFFSQGEHALASLLSRRCSAFMSVTARRETVLRAGLFDPALPGTGDYYRSRSGSLTSDRTWMIRHSPAALEEARQRMELSPAERDLLRFAAGLPREFVNWRNKSDFRSPQL